jgi:hypothetical protein
MPLDTASACQARQALAALNAQIAEATAARDVARRRKTPTSSCRHPASR